MQSGVSVAAAAASGLQLAAACMQFARCRSCLHVPPLCPLTLPAACGLDIAAPAVLHPCCRRQLEGQGWCGVCKARGAVPGNAGLSRCHQPAQLPLGCAAHCCCALMYTTVLPWSRTQGHAAKGAATRDKVVCCVCVYARMAGMVQVNVVGCLAASLRPVQLYCGLERSIATRSCIASSIKTE